MPRLSPPERLASVSLTVTPGQDISPVDLGDLLSAAGYTRQDPVDESGEFCVRGGVVDFFPAGARQPLRLEFMGDTIESIRTYDPATQRSTAVLDQAAIAPLQELITTEDEDERKDRSATAFDYLWSGQRPLVLVSEPDEVHAQGEKLTQQIGASYEEAVAKGVPAAPPSELIVWWEDARRWLEGATLLETLEIGGDSESGTPSRHVSCQPAMEFNGRVQDWAAEIRRGRERGDTILFIANTAGRAERTIEVLADYDIFAVPIERAEDANRTGVLVGTGYLSSGFRLPEAGLQLWAETDVFEEERKVHERRRSATATFLSDFRDLKVGDLVVHVDHGIGVFVGLKRIEVGVEPQEFMELRYAGDDKLFVPVERLDLVQRYTGAARPALDRLGGTTWEKAKTRVKKAMRDMAEELLKLYAARRAMQGHAFSPDSHWQQEFEDAFEWDLTPDQTTAIADIKRDMESPTTMDRLLCGDVGYGKTEVAMRAAFKAVMDGKQVAVLAPTTVLAFQHLKTLKNRFAAFPVRIDMVSRFRSKAEQKATLEDLVAGKVEIIVGTHRLLSKDVEFRDLGLLVVDEEQRFGVAHKEKIKQLRKRVDVLTMTATPIPRTLNMSLAGIRDMSIIETPPKDRLAIQTNVVKFDSAVISRAIRTEIERGGQIYFVHNRVESIYSLGNLITRLVPEARIAIGHGQMGEDQLENVMVDFVAHKYDVLLATTIIENGLDIPNANTMIINRADRYGLSQLYQLRGRVGRSDRRAYAYLLIPPEEALSAGGQEASRRHPRVQRPWQRLPRRRARSGDSRRRQPARRRAERPHRSRRLRHVHEAARADDQGAEGRGDRRPDSRQRESPRRSPHRRRVHPRHEPAVDGLPPVCSGQERRRAGPPDGRGARPLRQSAGVGPQSRGICGHPAHGRPPGHRIHRPRGADRRHKVQARGEARPAVAVQGGPGAWRHDAGAPGDAETRHAHRAGRPQTGSGASPASQGQVKRQDGPGGGRVVVDRPCHGRPGYERLLPGRDPASGEGGPAGRGWRLYPRGGVAPRVECRRVVAVKYCVSET